MAEALAAVGAASSIIQIIDVGGRVLDCLMQYQANFKEVPETFRHIHDVLPILRDILGKTKTAIDSGSVPQDTVVALSPVVMGCVSQIQMLDDLLKKCLPQKDSWGEKAKKAFCSTAKDSKVNSITNGVLRYVNILTFYYAAMNSTFRPREGESLLSLSLRAISKFICLPYP